MTASLQRIKIHHLAEMERLVTLPRDIEENLDVDVHWDSIMYIFGNGSTGAPITGDIFMPETRIKAVDADEFDTGIGYHTPEDINQIHNIIGKLTESDIRSSIVPRRMGKVYRFDSNSTDVIVNYCLAVISLFARAHQDGNIVAGNIDC